MADHDLTMNAVAGSDIFEGMCSCGWQHRSDDEAVSREEFYRLWDAHVAEVEGICIHVSDLLKWAGEVLRRWDLMKDVQQGNFPAVVHHRCEMDFATGMLRSVASNVLFAHGPKRDIRPSCGAPKTAERKTP